MTQDYQDQQAPPTPVLPDELIQLWWNDGVSAWSHYNLARCTATWTWDQAMTTLAEREQAAADAQLEWCCNFLLSQFGGATWNNGNISGNMTAMVNRLRAARRPKPPTLAEKGLAALNTCDDDILPSNEREIRAALLRLQELEQGASTTTTTETAND